jgi:hypothetical protein
MVPWRIHGLISRRATRFSPKLRYNFPSTRRALISRRATRFSPKILNRPIHYF